MATIAQSPFLFDNLDDDSADLILQLQLHDLEEFKQSRTGKQREGSGSDAEIAAGLLEETLGDLRTFLADRRMTKSIARAVQADGIILTQSALEEEAAHEDHALAHRLNGTNIDSEVKVHSESIDDTTLSKLAGLYVSEALGRGTDEEPETSTWAAMRRDTRDGNPDRHCDACREPKKYFDVVAAPCNHEYCRDCLRDLFGASLTDESLFPPRCCRQNIPLDAVSIFLTSELKQEFQQKKVEFSTPNRTYCSRPQCSFFISAENIVDEIANCPSCAARTCTICKSESHEGQDCPRDTALQATMNLARDNGWQRCYSCRRLVELDIGCNHITCRCGHQFCYICGARWKTCTCLQWNEDRLLARANQVVQRDVPQLPANNPDRIGRVQEAARILRDRHNCAHQTWRYIPGPHQCEECYFHLPKYIFECRQCRILACNRCRRNRL
ncbi:uncharacterized protein PV07_12768 [Cladophialophora immunda]|uniref:RBR-type E3 ubiquitin transferase n=1 Tax=Cladophialophora immunda TaxID=569365 RepID=A0A0D1Z297_9EURO|nr:uncharacterized protein PV07_12768 [Cladophialophora immunda]KIW21806.1 hypothetical protein PV07_12768 [Cladophialophora immunda]